MQYDQHCGRCINLIDLSLLNALLNNCSKTSAITAALVAVIRKIWFSQVAPFTIAHINFFKIFKHLANMKTQQGLQFLNRRYIRSLYSSKMFKKKIGNIETNIMEQFSLGTNMIVKTCCFHANFHCKVTHACSLV